MHKTMVGMDSDMNAAEKCRSKCGFPNVGDLKRVWVVIGRLSNLNEVVSKQKMQHRRTQDMPKKHKGDKNSWYEKMHKRCEKCKYPLITQ